MNGNILSELSDEKYTYGVHGEMIHNRIPFLEQHSGKPHGPPFRKQKIRQQIRKKSQRDKPRENTGRVA